MANGVQRWGWILAVGMMIPASLAVSEDGNSWPIVVRNEGEPFFEGEQVRGAGPFFEMEERSGGRLITLRPFWTQYVDEVGGRTQTHFLYPLLNLYSGDDFQRGHLLNLVRWSERAEGKSLEVFPIFFSRSGEEKLTLALWPLGGTLHNRFGRERIDFVAWPGYVRTLRDGERRDHYLYPFVSVLSGPESTGWGVWPLWGRFERTGDYRREWAMWPFYYHYVDDLDEAVPYERFGIWPLYTRETAEGLRSETWGWPFFGYTAESAPRPDYFERRWLWPFWVSGTGEEKEVQRWLPFYAREQSPGKEEIWWAWPLWKEERFEEAGRLRERQTLLYFLYRDERQSLVSGEARLNTLWPLWGYWADGAGRRQLQVLDPLTVFFPSNPVVKDTWSPLFALYTYEEREGRRRGSLLWDLCVWESGPEGGGFQVGPLFRWESGKGWAILKGLIGREGPATGRRWTLFWNEEETVAD
ncbi:MAG: hypothetical protein RL648_1819 [Verrucomicrobiota bacterium]